MAKKLTAKQFVEQNREFLLNAFQKHDSIPFFKKIADRLAPSTEG